MEGSLGGRCQNRNIFSEVSNRLTRSDSDLYRESSKQVHNHRDFSTGSQKAILQVMKCIPQVCPPFEQGSV
jgi:hypothetical protein